MQVAVHPSRIAGRGGTRKPLSYASDDAAEPMLVVA
jgi:hypothetical protein